MERRNQLLGTGAALGMLVLILDGQTAISGASEGISLCLRTVIPSLFPFFLLSCLLTGVLSGSRIPLLRPLSRLCKTPEGTEALLAVSFLGGYPVGAQCISQAYESGRIGRGQAQRMLSFCNNAGPSFIFGMAAMQFSSPIYGWLIWTVLLLSAIAVALILPASREPFCFQSHQQPVSATDALHRSLKIMGSVCGWVIIFRVITQFLDRWFLWMLPKEGRTLISGLLELANGCFCLGTVESEGLRLIICCLMMSLGGLCVLLQTSSVLHGLSIIPYLKGKALQGCISLALALYIQPFLPDGIPVHPALGALILLAIVVAIFFREKDKKAVAFLQQV